MSTVARLNEYCGELIDAIFVCGTDFGTQDSQFCSADTFHSLYLPHYRKLNEWAHRNTKWKMFKHCCGSIPTFGAPQEVREFNGG